MQARKWAMADIEPVCVLQAAIEGKHGSLPEDLSDKA